MKHYWELDLVSKAEELARRIHTPLLDKGGKPMIGHVQRVAGNFRYDHSPRLYVIALLHDVVEDSDTTVDYISEVFGYDISTAVDALTHRVEVSEPYWDYIERVAANPLAIPVKLADLLDNLDPKRTLAITDEREFKRVSEVLTPRYLKAYRYLNLGYIGRYDKKEERKNV